MAIFKPTKIKGDIVIYSKWCIPCTYPELLTAINMYALNNDLDVQVIRTAYRPADHKKATEFWAQAAGLSEDDAANYPTFVVYKNIYDIEEFVKMITNTKNKLVKKGKAKDDVQRLSKAKRVKRKNSLDGEASKTSMEDEK